MTRDPEIVALREKLAQRVRPTDIGERRQGFDTFASACPTAPDIVVTPVTANGVAAEWTAAPDADHSRAVLFLHGGGYVVGSLDSHRHLGSEVGRAAGARSCTQLQRRRGDDRVHEAGKPRASREAPILSCSVHSIVLPSLR
jgi:acetyl esterase/lipase